MLEKSGLYLRRGKSVPRDVNNIVHAAPDPVVAFMIPASAVASELQLVSRITKMESGLAYVVALVHIEIGIHITFMSTPDGSGHARPGFLNSQNPLYVVAMYFFSGDRINNRGLNAKER